jgi:hypothetical protein
MNFEIKVEKYLCDAWLDEPKRRNMLDRKMDVAPIGAVRPTPNGRATSFDAIMQGELSGRRLERGPLP